VAPVFPAQERDLQRLVGLGDQHGGVEGLHEVGEDPRGGDPAHLLDVGGSRDDHRSHFGPAPAHLQQQVAAVAPRHDEVRDNEVDRPLQPLEDRPCFGGGGGDKYLHVACFRPVGEHRRDHVEHHCLVVHDEDPARARVAIAAHRAASSSKDTVQAPDVKSAR
jgi:hypothetical protein